MVKLTNDVSDSAHVFSLASAKVKDDLNSVFNFDFITKFMEHWEIIIIIICATVLIVGLAIAIIFLLCYCGKCCDGSKREKIKLSLNVRDRDDESVC